MRVCWSLEVKPYESGCIPAALVPNEHRSTTEVFLSLPSPKYLVEQGAFMCACSQELHSKPGSGPQRKRIRNQSKKAK